MPPLNLYARVRFFTRTYCTRDRGCSVHPVFPAPSLFGGWQSMQSSGEMCRENAKVRLMFGRRPILRKIMSTQYSRDSSDGPLRPLRTQGRQP